MKVIAGALMLIVVVRSGMATLYLFYRLVIRCEAIARDSYQCHES